MNVGGGICRYDRNRPRQSGRYRRGRLHRAGLLPARRELQRQRPPDDGVVAPLQGLHPAVPVAGASLSPSRWPLESNDCLAVDTCIVRSSLAMAIELLMCLVGQDDRSESSKELTPISKQLKRIEFEVKLCDQV